MFDKLDDLLIRFEEVLNELGEPGVSDNQEHFQKLMKEQSDLQPIVDAYREYKKNKETIQDSLAMLEEEKDEEMREMLKEELSDAKKNVEELEHELKILLLPKDPNDNKNVIVEIRAGAGGDEAALFAAEIYRMYVKYAESRRWKTEMMSLNENGIGGFKEVTFMITGAGAYSRLKYESGVHRVQRVPETESGGRIHTSTCTVAIMPEAEEIDFHLDMNDCKFDVFRASGNGGQCVNTTDSAVRLTHIPTGIVISCQDEKSQLKNKDKALKVLRSRLYEMELEKQQAELGAERQSQIGHGNRSEKIGKIQFQSESIRAFMCRRGPENVGYYDKRHEHSGQQSNKPLLFQTEQPNRNRNQRAGCQNLISPCKVVPQMLERLRIHVRPPKQGGNDHDQRKAEQDAIADLRLSDPQYLRQTQPQTAHRGVSGSHGNLHQHLRRIVLEHGGEKIIDRKSGGSPDHGNNAFHDHHTVKRGTSLPFRSHCTGNDRRLRGVKSRKDPAGDRHKQNGQNRIRFPEPEYQFFQFRSLKHHGRRTERILPEQ